MPEIMCHQCGYKYISEITSDIRQHRSFHDRYLRGVRFRPAKGENVIYSIGDKQVVLITNESQLTQRKKAYQISLDGMRDTDFDFSSYYYDNDPANIFIVRINYCAVSFLVIEPIKSIHQLYKFHWNDNSLEIFESRLKYGIRFIWTLSPFRRKGLGTLVLGTACSVLKTTIDDLAWSLPFTFSGNELAKKLDHGMHLSIDKKIMDFVKVVLLFSQAAQ